ncbi:hypothetical protein TOPH_05717 [Tolypocladium ophioglossoides CBS 100239]|uniref:Uncharacterized protein n=1 Tax=Tolypocladium ophioglossoides (strain CBS 100239) TaxID=1163406 RepID=A0A0L0N674_TOLOC|nr:hypothetical protein TOPH_05717 [Tolypocladium ophioglossoides CBS 100239]
MSDTKMSHDSTTTLDAIQAANADTLSIDVHSELVPLVDVHNLLKYSWFSQNCCKPCSAPMTTYAASRRR